MSRVKVIIFWVVAGAILGLVHATGFLAFWDTGDDNPDWKPISREEYLEGYRRYPIYGGAAGLVVGVLTIARTGSRSDASRRDG